MITNADLISIAFDFLGRRGSSPPAPRFSASFALRPLASASTPVAVATVGAVQTPAAERSNRSAIAPATLTDRAPGVHNQSRSALSP